MPLAKRIGYFRELLVISCCSILLFFVFLKCAVLVGSFWVSCASCVKYCITLCLLDLIDFSELTSVNLYFLVFTLNET